MLKVSLSIMDFPFVCGMFTGVVSWCRGVVDYPDVCGIKIAKAGKQAFSEVGVEG